MWKRYEQELDKSSGGDIGCPIALVALLGYPGRWRHQWDGNAEYGNCWIREKYRTMNKLDSDCVIEIETAI